MTARELPSCTAMPFYTSTKMIADAIPVLVNFLFLYYFPCPCKFVIIIVVMQGMLGFFLSGDIHMWFVLFLIIGAVLTYSSEKIPLELTSIIIFSLLLLFFHFFPLEHPDGETSFAMADIVAGFANPALIAVIGLLIVGQSVVQTGALNEVANVITRASGNHAIISISLTLLLVMVISAMLNNTPVVVMFIPIIAAVAKNFGMSPGNVMMPLSFAAILGGMTTLIGSSTNLLVSGTLQGMGLDGLNFFDFAIPGTIMAVAGLLYIVFLAPRLLPDRSSLAKEMVGEDDRQFISQIEVEYNSFLVGKVIQESKIVGLSDHITLRMVQRGEHAFLPPFDEHMVLRAHDILVVAARRKDIVQLLSEEPQGLLHALPKVTSFDAVPVSTQVEENTSLAEVIITPTSRVIGRSLEQVGFYHQHHCVVLGIQRQSKIIRARVSEIRLAAGDVLLVMGKKDHVMDLRQSKDLLLLEWSTEDIHSGKKALQSALILAAVVGFAAFNIVPIAISAFIGATASVLTGCLTLQQMRRSIDSQVVLVIAASLALGNAMQATGGDAFIAHSLVAMLDHLPAVMVMGVLFLSIVVVTNLLSNNASAVLFTPIAVNAAVELEAPIEMFVFAVIFASNCSFVTPIGYQTNLLVMGPGHYKFADFIRVGLPLSVLLWAVYMMYALWYW